jgi:hypothetical protein
MRSTSPGSEDAAEPRTDEPPQPGSERSGVQDPPPLSDTAAAAGDPPPSLLPTGLPAPWGVHTLVDDEVLALRLGTLDLWLRWRDGEIWLSQHDRVTGSGELATWGFGSPPTGPGKDAEWTRWATPAGEREVLLRPTLPDRSLVLETEWPFRLLPGAEAKVFVRVPLWIRIEVRVGSSAGKEGRPVRLKELPTVGMSDTWWGELHHGELAYWLPTTARRTIAKRHFAPHLAACPLVMRNRAEYDLEVEKLALRVDHLSLFAEQGRIWSDETSVTYHGGEKGSEIDMTGRPPSQAEGAGLVSGPRTPIQRGLAARTFDRLRAFPGLGGGP